VVNNYKLLNIREMAVLAGHHLDKGEAEIRIRIKCGHALKEFSMMLLNIVASGKSKAEVRLSAY